MIDFYWNPKSTWCVHCALFEITVVTNAKQKTKTIVASHIYFYLRSLSYHQCNCVCHSNLWSEHDCNNVTQHLNMIFTLFVRHSLIRGGKINWMSSDPNKHGRHVNVRYTCRCRHSTALPFECVNWMSHIRWSHRCGLKVPLEMSPLNSPIT